jgi:hypothetical protein
VETVEIAPGLGRWTARHPGAAGWPVDAVDGRPSPEEVGCVYLEASDAVCMIDPLVPPGEEDQFFLHLDPFSVDRSGTLGVYPSPSLTSPAEVEASLAELTALPVERLLVSHGEPVLEHARERMAEAVERGSARR